MKRYPSLLLMVSLYSAGVVLSGCVRHIYPYGSKVREYQAPEYAAPDEARTEGSLWSEGAHGLFEDARARRVGDIVTIRIDERSDATRDANTKTSRESENTYGISAFMSAMASMAASNPSFDPSRILATSTSNDFQGGGATKRSGKLHATLPVRIKKTLPNGDYYVEGQKVLLLNEEESHLYISGVVRPIDISPDNSVPSFLLADVELEYTGRGVVSERQSPGVLTRILDYIWPF